MRIGIIFTFMLFFIVYGCEGTGISRVDIPTVLNGDWRMTGSLIADDSSRRVDIDQDFSILDGRVYLDGGEEIDGAFVGSDLIIKFKAVVFEDDNVDTGYVKVTADVSIITQMLDDDEPEYYGTAVGVFNTESERDGNSSVQLGGSFILKRI